LAISGCPTERSDRPLEPATIPQSAPLPGGIRDRGPAEIVSPSTKAAAPDDTGDKTVTHDYKVTNNNVESTFVWIPEFVAYQIFNPTRSSTDSSTLPVGAWVRKPATGSAGTDWASASFGGFYVAKYEASRADAAPGTATSSAGATAGTSTTLKSARYCVPWTQIDWDEARKVSQAYNPKADLMGDEEWTALAVWASITSESTYSVRGNNSFLRDKDRPDITFVGDPTYGGGRALTGSGASSFWTGDVNLTTHTLTTAGVSDLNGNVFEWTRTLGLDIAEPGIVRIGDATASWRAPILGSGYIAALATGSATDSVQLLGLPTVTGAAPNGYFPTGYFFLNPSSQVKPFRGGSWSGAARSGLWYLALGYPRTYSFADLGFRPVLKY
jgi:formylglycine-generating enzyme required for sulfatase activity